MKRVIFDLKICAKHPETFKIGRSRKIGGFTRQNSNDFAHGVAAIANIALGIA